MNVNISPIIQASELLKLYKSENLIIVDVSNGKNAKSNYKTKHLDGAIFVDLNTQLAEDIHYQKLKISQKCYQILEFLQKVIS
jgi:3-mercaptopyruvate sulfurtransferase SseA